jgi:hypothetical protein
MYPRIVFMERYRVNPDGTRKQFTEYVPVSISGYRDMISLGGFENAMMTAAHSVYRSNYKTTKKSKYNPYLTAWSVKTRHDIDINNEIAEKQRNAMSSLLPSGIDANSIAPHNTVQDTNPIPLKEFYKMIGWDYKAKKWDGKTARQYVMENTDITTMLMEHNNGIT